ncbi:MAG: hypothetical protein KAS16_07935, partial [Thermoplasmata archaeon]|nr:hypothetical protein [Thermoplasmata archaeon]
NDTIPSGTIFQSSTPAPSVVNGDDYSWNFPSIRKNTANFITITVMVDPLASVGTTITNWALLEYSSVSGTPYDGGSDSASITVIIIPEFGSIMPVIIGMMALTFIGFRRRKEEN